MVNLVRHYAWGSRTTLATLQGRPHTNRPEAELWMGSHPLAPSHLVRPDGERAPLPQHVAADPAGVLGSAVLDRFGERLPYLVKLLAVDTPLSLQVHPTAERARTGFATEEARGITRDASSRSYKDSFAKPELLCALTPFEALAGFRPAAEVASLLAALGIPRLRDLAAALTHAYLQGLGIEVMGSSDNVVRGGLTDKHVDVGTFSTSPTSSAAPRPWPARNPPRTDARRGRRPRRSFVWNAAGCSPDGRCAERSVGPTIFICVDGAVDVASDHSWVPLTPGTSAFADAATTVVLDGTGPVYRVQPGFTETSSMRRPLDGRSSTQSDRPAHPGQHA